MKRSRKQFLDPGSSFVGRKDAAAALLLFPYEGGVSYGKGTARAPGAVIEASRFLELYDEVLEAEPYRMGVVTLQPDHPPSSAEEMFESVYRCTRELMEEGKFVALLGGDHSISSGYVKVLSERFPNFSVVQLDAHADLRDTYEGSPLSHACVMSRIREWTPHTLQIGIRSLSVEEAERVRTEGIRIVRMADYRSGRFDLEDALRSLPDPVYLTLDVDVFDWGVIRSTGTPEPGGLFWHEAMGILETLFRMKTVVGFDVVELAHDPQDRNSPFAVSKLLYRMLGLKLRSYLQASSEPWPLAPRGPLF